MRRLELAVASTIAVGLCLGVGPSGAEDVRVRPGAGDGFVVTDQTGTIERLRVHEPSGDWSHNGSLFLHTPGSNLFVGVGAGNPAATGVFNSGFGKGALTANTTGNLNTAFGHEALTANTAGSYNSGFGGRALQSISSAQATGNSAFGQRALAQSVEGKRNSAFGERALYSAQVVIPSVVPSYNSAFGARALSSSSESGSGNSAFGQGALEDRYEITSPGTEPAAFGSGALNAIGGLAEKNSAFGYRALEVDAGYNNSAFGDRALVNSGNTRYNTAFGRAALLTNDEGYNNTAFGQAALIQNAGFGPAVSNNTALGDGALLSATSFSNSALGQDALTANTTGNSNIAVGRNALGSVTTGYGNIAVGKDAGDNLTTGYANIHIGFSDGAGSDSRGIRIGSVGTHTQTTIPGVYAFLSPGGVALYAGTDGLLTFNPSSIRFKRDVRDLGEVSNRLAKLRPVAFLYRDTEPDGPEEYGLLAEEVAEVVPALVTRDAEGRPYSVRYQQLVVVLLEEVRRQETLLESHDELIARLEEQVVRLEADARVARLEVPR